MKPTISPYDFQTDLYQKMDAYQREYLKIMRNTPVTFVDAPSGTGKTTLAILQGFNELKKGRCQKITYVRFVDDRFLSQGFLPGELEEKQANLFHPFFDAITELNIHESQLKTLQNTGQIELTTPTDMRGRNLKNTFLIIDEAQNARNVDDLHLILTRLHDQDSKAVIIGHNQQKDNRKIVTYGDQKLTPFDVYIYHMTKKPFARQAHLVFNYRGEISQWADEIWGTLEEL